jgi:hypothetical protein
LKFYIHALSNNDISPGSISKYLASDLAVGESQKRISIKGRLVSEDLNHLKALTNIDSTTDLLKGVVLKINDDVLVNKKSKTIRTLKTIVAATT